MIWTHVSELSIDRLLAGEVAAADAAAIRDHARSCAHCGALLDDALAAQRAFLTDRPRLALPVPLRPRRRAAPMLAAAGVLAAAAVLVIAWPRGGTAPGAAPVVRTKGTAIVGFFVAHGDHVRRGQTREPVMPGDRIELFTTTDAPTWFAAIGDDAAGHRSVYVTPRALDAGRERVLPLSIELDDTLGDEVVTGVFCTHLFDARAIDPSAPPAGCAVDRFTLVKVPR